MHAMSREERRNVVIVTNGGDVPGLTIAVLEAYAAVVENGSRAVGIGGGWSGLIALSEGASISDVSVPLDTSSSRIHGRVGGSVLGSARSTLEDPDVRSAVVEACAREGVDALIVVGGDGTLTSGADLSAAGIPVVGIPKTIDNDIRATPVALGFATAAARATDMLDAAEDTGRTHRRHVIVELMGRGSGALTLRAAVAAGVPAVIPEAELGPRAMESLLERQPYGAIAVAEGAFGWEAVAEGPEGGSAAATLARMLDEADGPERRIIVPGHLLRGGAPVPADRWLGRAFGRAAGLLACDGTSRLLASDGNRVWEEDLARAAEPPAPTCPRQVAAAGNLVVA